MTQQVILSRIFHQYATERRKRSRIKKLVQDDGSVVEEDGELQELITNYYKKLFPTNAGNHMEEFLQHVKQSVSNDMNNQLLCEFTEEEVRQGLDAIGDLKAPGADGMSSLFYKKHWSIVGADMVREVLTFLNEGCMPAKWNETVVMLIPEVQNRERLKDLRTLSLCNVIYKIASKVLSNCLKLILPEIISQSQSAFVPGRLISDNVLIAYDMTHYLQNKRSGGKEFAALKLDMSKAYNRVEWNY